MAQSERAHSNGRPSCELHNPRLGFPKLCWKPVIAVAPSQQEHASPQLEAVSRDTGWGLWAEAQLTAEHWKQ